MTFDVTVTLVILLLTLVALARELFSPPTTVVGAVVLLLVFGVVTPEQAFSGFSNPAPITVAALYVLARAVEKTGALQPLVSATLGRDGSPRGALLRLVLPTAVVGMFLLVVRLPEQPAPTLPAASSWRRYGQQAENSPEESTHRLAQWVRALGS